MWQNNGFHGHGNYQNHMDPANYQQSFDAEDGFIPFSSDGADHQFYQHPPQMPYNDDGHSFLQGFQPEVGLYNEQQFMQNPYLTQNSPEPYTPQLSNSTQATPRPGPELDARTRELRAKLMEGKAQRGQSGTPPVASAVIAKATKSTDGTNSLRQSPDTPVEISPPGEMESVSVTAEDLEDLLSEHRPVPANNPENEKPYTTSSFKAAQHQMKGQDALTIAQSSNGTSSIKLAKSNVRDISLIKTPNGKHNRTLSNGEGSEVSEGEIREEEATNAIQPKPSLNDTRNPSNLQNTSEQTVSKYRKEESGKKSHGTEGQATSPKLQTSVQGARAPLRYQEERHNPSEARYEKKNTSNFGMNERRSQQESEQRPLSRRASSDDPRKHETKYDTRREEVVSRKPVVPTLDQLLAIDEDLKEWLEITGYHKTEYRNKTLNRRRALAALDAQRARMDEEREKLLQELEKDERGGGLLASSAPSMIIPSPMPPPPVPKKIVVSPVKVDEESVRENIERSGKQEAGTKRNYDDYRGSRGEESTEKSARLGDDGRGYRIKGEAEEADRRSYPSGQELSRRRSPPPTDSRAYRQEDRESSYHMDDGGRGRGRTNDREDSPGLQAFHGRPPARSTSHGWHESDEFRDHDDRADRRDPRPYVVIGNYRGRDYDPNYRGRGRGRGNWANSNNDRDQHAPQAQQPPSPDHRRTFGQRLANGSATKDLTKWDRGGKGGQ